MSAVLQNLFTQPRDRSNSRYARENQVQRAVDSKHPNISYNLIDKQDYSKFRVLTDAEVELERTKSKELSRKLVATWQGRPTSAPSASHSQSKQQFAPPKLGMMSKSAKKEARAWEKSIHSMKSSGSIPNSSLASNGHSKSNDTLRRLMENTNASTVDLGSTSMSYAESSVPKSSASLASIVNEDDLTTVVEVMKTKFIENINVIDKLYGENKFMEKRIEMLEKEVRRIKGDNDENTEPNDNDAESLIETSSVKEAPRHRTTSPKPRPRSASNPSIRSRPPSRPRFNISPSLQADLDRYNQRMEMIRSKEKERERLQKEYKLIQKEKLLRVEFCYCFIISL
jgi:hypothetical protein